MNVDDSVRMALSEVTRPASVGSVSEVTAELGSLAGMDASGGTSIGSPPSYRPTLSPCFKCEYDVKEKRYVIREPKVIVPGQDKPIEPEDPGELQKNKTYVCAVTRENNKVKAEIVEEDKVPDDALVSVPICKIDDSRGFDIITQYHVGAIVLGGTTFVGDMDGSEVIGGAGEEVLVTGHPGAEDSSGQDSHSGIQFLTVSSREDGGETIPAKIIARIKDKKEDEDWGAKTMTVTPAGGSPKIVHFLGCGDVDIDLPGGSGGNPVVGSDYIKVEDEQDPKDQTKTNSAVKAKITTPDPDDRTIENPAHALLTHDTYQFIRAKKTFKSADGTKTIELDADTGVETIAHIASDSQKQIVLNPSQIPDNCKQKTIEVKTLTVTHPRAKTVDGEQVTSETYHILGCDDIDINEGDAIEKIESGTPSQSGGFTVTPVTITLKDGTKLPAFNISAKNGADGNDGDDGDDAGLKVTATTHQPTQSDPRTGVDVVLTPTINGVDQTPTTFTIYNGKQGVGIGSIEEDPSKSSGRTRTYNVMSDETEPKLLGTVVVTDGRSIGSVVLESSSGKTRTYAVMSADTPAVKIGTFTVTDGKDGDDGDSAGFGTPTATATELESGSTPTVAVTASGTDKAKVFAFQFGIPKGKNVKSDWSATSGDAQILNKPSSLKNPYSLTIKKSGSSDVVYDGSAAKTITLDPGGVTKIIGSGAIHVSPSSGTGEVTVLSTVRNLVAGSGISLTAIGNDITITNTAQGGGGGETTEGFTGTAPWLDGFKYDKTAHKLMYRFGNIRFENGLAVEYTSGGDSDFVDVPGGDAVEETV